MPTGHGGGLRQRGLTLVETFVVLGILAITLGLALPAMRQWVDGVRMGTLARAFHSDLQLTRTEAIRRGQRVVLCTAAGVQSCSSQPGWHQGWLMFVDSNNNAWLDSGEPVLRHHGPVPAGWSLWGNQPVARYVSYGPLGETRRVSGAFQAGSVYVCRDGGAAAGAPLPRRVAIASTGRPRTLPQHDHSVCP
ncbi:MAG: type IV fimbrial biogenesis protein FimT [Burkholderiales bacterium]|nr:MAG: type IV fimbrial biogenesis protein FimT [Burkholderiales bacterium]